MKTDSRITKVLLLTLISMLTLGIGIMHLRAAEKPSHKYTGTYHTEGIRAMWAACFNASIMKRMHPDAATRYCDCFIDRVRAEHTKAELDNVKGKAEIFTGYANVCGIKVFGSPTPSAGNLTHGKRLPSPASRWLEAMFIKHNKTTLAKRRGQRG